MRIYITGISTLVIGLFMMGATCSPLSPPAFAPSKSLMNFSDESFNYRLYGGCVRSVWDINGEGAGIEVEYSANQNGLGINAFFGNGSGPFKNKNSLLETGLFLTKYYGDKEDFLLMAFEPRLDMAFITNESASIIPNILVHYSLVFHPFEIKFTLRGGTSRVVNRGKPIIVEEIESISLFGSSDDKPVYIQSYLLDTVFLGLDIGLLYHFNGMYAGFSLVYMHISAEENHDYDNYWVSPMVIFGHSIY